MKYFYDLHIHSALSPCGDDDMTPNNIVNMSIIKGLDIIAVADHNTAGNLRAVMKAAEGTELLVVPAIEVETSEEVHMLCLFPTIEAAEEVSGMISEMLFIKNKPEIFGEQRYMNANDEVVGLEEKLLITASGFDVYEIHKKVSSLGGIAIFAHINREANGALTILGFLPPDIKTTTIELRGNQDEFLMQHPEFVNYRIINNSDAHYLENINEPLYNINLLEKSAEALIEKLAT